MIMPHIRPLISPQPTKHPAARPVEHSRITGRISRMGAYISRLLLPVPAFASVADGLSEQKMPLILY